MRLGKVEEKEKKKGKWRKGKTKISRAVLYFFHLGQKVLGQCGVWWFIFDSGLARPIEPQ